MRGPRNPLTLKYEDLISRGPGPAAGPDQDQGQDQDQAGGAPAAPADLIGSIEGVLDRANTLVANVKEVIGIMRGAGPGPGPGPGQAANQIYAPQPTIAQQLQRVVNICYSAYGDISIMELLQKLAADYGGAKLSQIIKLLEK